MTAPVYTQSAWSLTDLFPTGQADEMDAAFARLDDMVGKFETRRGELREDLDPAVFLDMLRQQEEISLLASRLSSYAHMRFAADTRDQSAVGLVARVQQFMAEISNRTMFFSLWWKMLSAEPASLLLAAAGDLRYWLEEMRHFKPYTLTEPEEKIINLKDVTGSSALSVLYDTITNRFSFKLRLNGVEKELTRGELSVFARHYDPDLRARSYQELYRVYGGEAPVLGQIYQTLVRDWHNEQLTLRGFKKPISVRNLANDIPNDVVDTLLEVCSNNAPIFQHFFRLKARWLGVEKLRRYDIYAPVARSDKKYPFEQGAGMVLGAFEEFDPRFRQMAEKLFSSGHIDSQVRVGKESGGFCLSAAPDLTPWVLLNYHEEASDVAVMAHELGHAIHSVLASQHSIFTFHPSLPLAETASTFGEMTLVDRLLSEETNEDVRRDLLFRQVDDSYATIMRQAYFALFERQAHELVNGGASVDELAAAYMENLRGQFGDSVELSDEFKWEWVSIPHIFQVPFYVYAYSFGQLLVLSLYRQFKAEGAAFKPRYLQILSSGGADSPSLILSRVGIDIRQPSFWQGGFDVVAGMVRALEGIPVKP